MLALWKNIELGKYEYNNRTQQVTLGNPTLTTCQGMSMERSRFYLLWWMHICKAHKNVEKRKAGLLIPKATDR